MVNVSTHDLGIACRLFLKHAYPAGLASVPARAQLYADIASERPLGDYLPPAAGSEACQLLPGTNDELRGFTLRLGCAHFPHLKLKVQIVDHHGTRVPVFAVDTHDAFSSSSSYPPDDHPDAQAWMALQRSNRELKQEIEADWLHAGLTTFTSLLRSDLAATR